MKITPDNFAAVFEYMVGEPGPADFHDSLTEMHACRCDNCGTWWCDGETLVAGDFSDESLCIECWEGFSDVWCEGISAREHEAASAAKATPESPDSQRFPPPESSSPARRGAPAALEATLAGAGAHG